MRHRFRQTAGNRFAATLAIMALLSVSAVAASPAAAGERIAFAGNYRPGTIVVDTSDRRLYFVERGGTAIRYRVAVGKPGRQWQGSTVIRRKAKNPVWAAPAAVRRDFPNIPATIPPGPRNPLGIAAMALAGGEYAIHGTNRPGLIGKAVSYGCIRMTNRDVTDLYDRVRVGTRVIVRP